MKVEDDETISAQVILKSLTGHAAGPTSEITSRTLHEYTPSIEATAEATAAFEKLGFEVGPLVGIAFSITGASCLFRKVFDVQLELGEEHALNCVDSGGITDSELPTSALTSDLSRLIVNIVFDQPAELM